jgi:hypothetical protein
MATAATPNRSSNLTEAGQRVRSPLERLRSYIRTYVSLEGAAVVGLYLALWFWIGLILDYGVFRAFSLDWVQTLPWGARLGVLLVLVSGLLAALALKVLTRLFREFRDTALALVLERRFPQILGDRLITAVELSDPKQAAAQGYSAAMVQETIHEAAQRVEQLPIPEVFDWRRLRRSGALVAILLIGSYLVTGIGYLLGTSLTSTGFLITVGGLSAALFVLAFLPVAITLLLKRVPSGQVIATLLPLFLFILIVPALLSVGDSLGEIGNRPAEYLPRFNDVSGIWIQRNILLQNTIWPRKAHLELIDFPAAGEVRIGRGERAPALRVRALKYVIAGAPSRQAVDAYREWLSAHPPEGESVDTLVQQFSKKPEEGWRPVSWFDLTPELLGAPVPAVALPVDWEVRDRRAGLTLDEIELKLDKPETHRTLAPEVQEAMRNVLEQLETRTADPDLSHRLRKLQVPEVATLYYRGNTTSSQTTLQKLADNEYTGQFGDLKETVHFNVQGLDYYTATRQIVVVEPPVLESLTREEERPAYLYYRLNRGDNPDELSGKKQQFETANVSLQGGEVSRIDVPIGTNLVLTARASKDLQSVVILPHKSQKTGVDLVATPPERIDARTFRTTFQNLRQEQHFLFKFTDTDGVTGQRQVVIMPSEDAPPKVRELAPDEIVRKVQGGFMVTVSARIPFKGQVDDDHGLNDVRYAYAINRLESARINRRAPLAVGAVPLFSPLGQGALPGLVYLGAALQEAARSVPQKGPEAVVEHYALPRFDQALHDRPNEFLPVPAIRELLAQKQKEPYRTLVRNFTIKPDDWRQPELDPLGCDLPLWKFNLKMTDPLRAQARYQMQIWVEAIDTDLDSDKGKDGRPQPHLKASEEKFTFFIVSENELLAEIAKEEEKLYAELDGTYQRLQENEAKLIRTTQDLSSERIKIEELGNMSVRSDQINEVLEQSQIKAREIAQSYARILKEMQTNQVSQKFLDKVEKDLVNPLGKLDGTFDQARDAVAGFHKALDDAGLAGQDRVGASRIAGDLAKAQVRELVVSIERILAAMQGMTDINKLVKLIAAIEKAEQEQYDTIKKINEELEEKLFDKATKPSGEK